MVTKTIQNYQLKGNPVIDIPVPIVGNLIHDELGEVVLAKLNERFRGYNRIEDTREYKKGEPLSFSNTPRALFAAQVLAQENDGEIQLLTPAQVVQYLDRIPDKPETYSDTSAVAVFPNPHKDKDNETLRRRALSIVGIDPSELEIPLLIQGLDVNPDQDNKTYGFTFDESKVTPYAILEAQFLQKDQDQRVKYDSRTNKLMPSDDNAGFQIWTPNDQAGLLGVYRGRGDDLNFRYDVLLYSNSNGRVQVLQDPQGRAENLDDKIMKAIQEGREFEFNGEVYAPVQSIKPEQ